LGGELPGWPQVEEWCLEDVPQGMTLPFFHEAFDFFRWTCTVTAFPRKVLVTGATSGIGLAIAKELATHGFEVMATARNLDKAEQLRVDLGDLGSAVHIVTCDLESPGQIDAAITDVFTIWPAGPWALINNAGFAAPGAVEDVSAVIAEKQLAVNVLAPAHFIRAFVPSMRAQRTGRIINISSISGRVTSPFVGWYSASKFALESLSDALRMEIRDFGIDVILVEPAGFASSIWGNAVPLMPKNADTGPYQRAYARARKLVDSAFPEPSPVAAVVREALESGKPKTRYLIGKGSRAIPYLRLLPTPYLDLLMEFNLGLRRPPLILRAIIKKMKR